MGGLGLFLWESAEGAALEVARTAAVNALVIGEIAYLFNCRRLTGSALNWSGLVGNPYIWWATAILLVFQGVFTYLPIMQTLFGTAGLDAATWGRIMLFGLMLFLVIEAEKALLALRERNKS